MAQKRPIEPPKPTGRPRGSGTGPARDLTPEEIKRLLAACSMRRHAERNRALVWLALGGGLRLGEVVGLQVGDVFDDRGQALDSFLLEKHSTKNGRSRRVYLAAEAQKELALYAQTLPSPLDLEAPLFPSQKGRGPMTASAVVKLVNGLLEEASIPGATSHSLRKTHANLMRRTGCDLVLIQAQLGHRSLATTQRYLMATPAELGEAVRKLRFIRGRSSKRALVDVETSGHEDLPEVDPRQVDLEGLIEERSKGREEPEGAWA